MECLKLMEQFDDYVIAYAEREDTRLQVSEVSPLLQHAATNQVSQEAATLAKACMAEA